jgi:hypothetical protein
MRLLIPALCTNRGGFPLANFKLAFTSKKQVAEVKNMMRLVTTAAMLWSIAAAGAQEPTGSPSSTTTVQQTCVFAGESYSDGAEFCVTSHAGLQCENGKWSRDTQLDCGGENTMMQGGDHMGAGGDDHMMHDHMLNTMPHD